MIVPIALGFLAVSPTAGEAQLPSPAMGGEAAPPAAIAGLDARPVAPLEFSRAWLGKAEMVRRRRSELHALGFLDGMTPSAAAAAGAALAGVLRVPVLPVRYLDVPEPFAAARLQERLFGAPEGDTLSYSAYWAEVSGGLLTVEGAVAPWTVLTHRADYYLPRADFGWARFGRMSEFREEVLRSADPTIEFGQFDNDGPDGLPNSGDDDGFVDFVAFVYANRCTGDVRSGAIWPHRGTMPPFLTDDRTPDGRRIQIADYVVLPAVDRATCGPLHVGVLAHETAHAFGLPDLYDYDGSSDGIGPWGLMGTGSHGERFSPAHPSAWAKEQLGWVRVDWIAPDADRIDLGPVQRERTVLRHDLPGDRYLLLENRQQLGSDARLPSPGLLAWLVDPDRGELGAWNTDERRPAVRLVEADAGARNRTGDPFPSLDGLAVLDAGGARPLRLSSIRHRGDRVAATLRVGHDAPALLPDPAVLWMASHDASPVERSVRIERAGPWTAADWVVVRRSGDWMEVEADGERLQVRADPAGLDAGIHAGVVELALEGSPATIARVRVYLSIAEPGVPQVIATDLPWSWGLAVSDGEIFQASYGWDPLGLRPRPRMLRHWDGQPHPESLARVPADALYAPVATEDGGAYVVARAAERNYLYRIDRHGRAAVAAAEIGKQPIYGAAKLPNGEIVLADWEGRLFRVDADGRVRTWDRIASSRVYQIATDAAGTVYAATLTGEIVRRDPRGWQNRLMTGFGRGRLVAIAASPDGYVYAAERGGEGRIIEIDPAGRRRLVTRVRGAEFYGLAYDDGFLYGIDLRHRQLVRVPVEPTGPAPIIAAGQ